MSMLVMGSFFKNYGNFEIQRVGFCEKFLLFQKKYASMMRIYRYTALRIQIV